MAFAQIPVADYIVTEGEASVAAFASSDIGRRKFCARCGTPLLMIENGEPATLSFSLATLDAPGEVVPGYHVYYASRIAWAEAHDKLPRYPRSRSEGGATPC